MTRSIFSPIVLLIALFTTATVAEAGIISLFDAATEVNPQPSAGDQNTSVINTAQALNGVYDTRSLAIGGNTNSPHRSGIVPDTPTRDGHLYVQSSATGSNHNFNLADSPYHEFTITIQEDQLNLDTLSYNYWATDFVSNDPEGPSEIGYESRVRAQVSSNGANSAFQSLATTVQDSNILRIQNSNTGDANGVGSFAATSRAHLVEFGLSNLAPATGFTVGDVVTFQVGFADYQTNSLLQNLGAGPDDGTHLHRIDNVQVAATSASAVPEPSAAVLLMACFGILGLRRQR